MFNRPEGKDGNARVRVSNRSLTRGHSGARPPYISAVFPDSSKRRRSRRRRRRKLSASTTTTTTSFSYWETNKQPQLGRFRRRGRGVRGWSTWLLAEPSEYRIESSLPFFCCCCFGAFALVPTWNWDSKNVFQI